MDKVLYTTASATNNHEKLIEVAQKNIVNANNPNYIKQRANLVSDPQVGAEIESISLAINEMLLKSQYQKTSEHSSFELEKHYTEKIIDLFGIPKLYPGGGKGVTLSPNLSGALQTFFNSLNKLQLESNDSPDMTNAVSTVKNMAERVSQLAENLQKLRQEADGRIAESVNELNGHLKILKSLNDKLPLLKDNDVQYNDAKTKIINEMREISKIIDIKQRYDSHGGLVLESGKNAALLIKDGMEFKLQFEHINNLENYLDENFKFPALSVVNADAPNNKPQYGMDIVTSGTTDKIKHYLKGGKLEALFNLRDKLIPDTIKSLDQFATNLATKVNDVYANAVPETGFQSITSTQELGDDEGIYANNGKFKIAFFDPKTGEAMKKQDGSTLPILEFDLKEIKKWMMMSYDYFTPSMLKSGIESKFIDDYSSYGITVELVDASGNTVADGQKGHLRLKANNENFNFAIIDEGTNLNLNKADLDKSEKNGKFKGINQFFGFNKVFTNDNSAMSLKVSSDIIKNNKLDTAKVTVGSSDNYSIGKNNKDILKDLLNLQKKDLEFAGTSEMLKSKTTLSNFGNNLLIALNSKHHSITEKLATNKIELDAINEQIASQSGVNADEELLNIVQYEKAYLSTLKVLQTFNEYWKQFLNQV